MGTGSGITGWSTACLDERDRHYHRQIDDYRDIYEHLEAVCHMLTKKQFVFLYKNNGRVGCVIGTPDYVVNLHRRMQHCNIPSTVGIARPEVRS